MASLTNSCLFDEIFLCNAKISARPTLSICASSHALAQAIHIASRDLYENILTDNHVQNPSPIKTYLKRGEVQV